MSATTTRSAKPKSRKEKRAVPSSGIPPEIQNDPELQKAIAALPSNYNLEVTKTVWKIRSIGAKVVGLQLPEGLQVFACTLSDILERFTGAAVVILGDVTFGACCVDDLGAKALGVELLVHYGHSCLVPIDVTSQSGVQVLYVFVQIAFDTSHAVETVRNTISPGSKLAIAGTIQFTPAVHDLAAKLKEGAGGEGTEEEGGGEEEVGGEESAIVKRTVPKFDTFVPQASPLSPGEVLGCTSPRLPKDTDALIFIADGRFHLESLLIHNPHVVAFRYNPYTKVLSREGYDHAGMLEVRGAAVEVGQKAKRFGVILGTLGRQGNVGVLDRIRAVLEEEEGRDYFVLLTSELTPARLKRMEEGVDVWVQIACPRLSVDWSDAFSKPLLTPYEFFAAMKKTPWLRKDGEEKKEGDAAPSSSSHTYYPMDFYAKGSGEWTNYYVDPETLAREAKEREERRAQRRREREERVRRKKEKAEKKAKAAKEATFG